MFRAIKYTIWHKVIRHCLIHSSKNQLLSFDQKYFSLFNISFQDTMTLYNEVRLTVFQGFSLVIVYYVPRRIMRVITLRATMLAGDQSRDEAETKPRRDQSCEHFKRVS